MKLQQHWQQISAQYLGEASLYQLLPLFAWHISAAPSALLEMRKLKFSSLTGWVRSSCGQPSPGTDIECPGSYKLSPSVPKEVCCSPCVPFWSPRVGRTQFHPPLRWEICSKWFWGFVKKQNRKSAWIWSLTIFLKTCFSPRLFCFFKYKLNKYLGDKLSATDLTPTFYWCRWDFRQQRHTGAVQGLFSLLFLANQETQKAVST